MSIVTAEAAKGAQSQIAQKRKREAKMRVIGRLLELLSASSFPRKQRKRALTFHRQWRIASALFLMRVDVVFIRVILPKRSWHGVASLPNKKADVAEHPEEFHHVGLLFN